MKSKFISAVFLLLLIFIFITPKLPPIGFNSFINSLAFNIWMIDHKYKYNSIVLENLTSFEWDEFSTIDFIGYRSAEDMQKEYNKRLGSIFSINEYQNWFDSKRQVLIFFNKGKVSRVIQCSKGCVGFENYRRSKIKAKDAIYRLFRSPWDGSPILFLQTTDYVN